MKTKGFFVWIAAALLLAGMFSACKGEDGELTLPGGEGVISLSITPPNPSVERGGSQNFTAKVSSAGESSTIEAKWQLSNNISSQDTKFEDGKLTVGLDEAAASFTVTAKALGKQATAKVTVTEPGSGTTPGNAGQAATPTPSTVAGAVLYGAEITLSTITDGASIYYTIDGSAPSTDSTLYAGPIIITAATTIKAIAVKDGFTNSDVLAADYTVSLDGFLAWLGTDNNAASNSGSHTYTLTADESISPAALSYGNSTVSITLTGAGTERTVGLSSNGSLFTIGNGVTLTLGSNVTLRGHNGNTGPVVNVSSGGTLNIENGSKITGNNVSSGGGIYNSGMVNMSGGAISGNWTTGKGGGIYNDGTVNMSGGAISGNTAGGQGGGIYNNAEKTVNMSGSAVIYGSDVNDTLKNFSGTSGHAAYCSNNSPIYINQVLFGGKIVNNTIPAATQ